VLAHYDSKNNHVGEPFRTLLKDEFPRTSELDWEAIPASGESINDLPKSYSYTGDYLYYQRCPRNYMVFQHYGFAPSRSQTMFFGSLIHQTIEDLHEFLIAHRGQR
jgi:DNA helicase-2/ATP-dependent DNA helicase PcrA